MPFFNNPAFGRAYDTIAAMFAPPSGAEAAGWATASARQADTNRRGQVFDYATDPNFDQQRFDRMGVGAGIYTPNQSYYAVDKDDATKRYGFDTQATTLRANNAADNARALETNRLDNQRSAITDLFKPLDPGQVRPEVSQEFMDLLEMPTAPAVAGAPKAPTKDELEAAVFQNMTPEEQRAITFGSTPVENVITPEGPRVATRLDAVGQIPYEKSTNGITITNPDGTVTQIGGSDGSLDPTAGRQVDAKNDVVLEDIGRALGAIDKSPLLTTGVGAQVSGEIGGTPANDLRALLDGVKSNIGFDRLQAMRNASKTGGALGAVSERENTLLQSAYGSLEQSQSPEQLRYNLARLNNIYLDIIHGPGNGQGRIPLGGAAEAGATGPAVISPPAASPAVPSAAPAQPATQQDYDALPSGALFIDPDDGKTYRKP